MILLLSISLISGCMPAGPKALLDGKRLIEQGKYARAVEKLNYATSLLPTNAQAWNYFGLACHYAGRADDAERSYKRAFALNRDLTEAHYNLACLWLAQNKAERNEAARTELLAYTLRRVNSPDGFLKLGLVQLRLRDLSAADKSFHEAFRLNSKSAEALNGLGLVRLQRGRADEAAIHFRNALKLQPDYRPALLNLGIVAQENLKDRSLALSAFRQYVSLKPPPSDIETVRALVRQLEQENRPPPSSVPTSLSPPVRQIIGPNIPAPSTNAVVKPVSTNVPPRNPVPPKTVETTNLGRPLVVEPTPPPQNYETVKLAPEPVFRPAQGVPVAPVQTKIPEAEPRPENPPISTKNVAQFETHRSFLQRINPLNWFREDKGGASLTPLPGSVEPRSLQPADAAAAPSPGAVTNRGARYTYRSLLRPSPGNRAEAQPMFDQGVRAQQEHKLAEAAQFYRQAIQMDPGFYEAYYNLGLTSAETGDLNEALRSYEGALAARPEALDARYNFGLSLTRAGYVLDAANELEKVLVHYPNEGRVNLALGNLYAQQLGQPEKARQCYLHVLQHDPRNPQAASIRYWLAANPP